MPQNLINPFNMHAHQLPTPPLPSPSHTLNDSIIMNDSTTNCFTTRLPPIQTLTQYCTNTTTNHNSTSTATTTNNNNNTCTTSNYPMLPKPVPFISLFPTHTTNTSCASNNSIVPPVVPSPPPIRSLYNNSSNNGYSSTATTMMKSTTPPQTAASGGLIFHHHTATNSAINNGTIGTIGSGATYHTFPTPVPTLQQKLGLQQQQYSTSTSSTASCKVNPQKKRNNQSLQTSHLTFVNVQDVKAKKPTSLNCLIENSFQVSSVVERKDKSSIFPIRNDLFNGNNNTNNTIVTNNRKNDHEISNNNNNITVENPQEESNPFRTTSNRNLPKQAVSLMKEWLFSHQEYPYPTEEEKLHIQNETGLSQKRINYWFINARRRLLQKRPSRETIVEMDESCLVHNESSTGSTNSKQSAPKRCRKNSSASFNSCVTNVSHISNYSMCSSSTSGCSEVVDESSTSLSTGSGTVTTTVPQVGEESKMQPVVDSWVVDCLLTLREK